MSALNLISGELTKKKMVAFRKTIMLKISLLSDGNACAVRRDFSLLASLIMFIAAAGGRRGRTFP